MYKIRLSGYDYQTVAAAGGHSPAVLMSNYDESLEIEKKGLAAKVQENFYPKAEADDQGAESGLTLERLLEEIQKNPQLLAGMLRSMQPVR